MIKLKSLLSEETVAKHTPQGYDLIYGGIWNDGRVVARNAKLGNLHTAEMGRNRWIYDQSRDTVFWWHTPDFDSKDGVLKYLNRLGYNVEENKPMSSYYGQLTGGINELTTEQLHDKMLDEQWKQHKKSLMEGANAKNIEAFVRDNIQGTEWQGKVFAVGGFVRDEIMGLTPKDIDVVVDKPQGGTEFAVWLAKKVGIYKEHSNPVTFPKFGTAKLSLDGVVYNGVDLSGEDLEAVMPRSEQYNDPNSRKPDVAYTDLKGDASRRDLTINAVYKDISTGQFLDPVGGVEDIKNHVIRTPIDPDLIYSDDALRMFRVIRFATKFGWELSPEVINGIKRNINRLNNTSKERIRDEINKILVTNDPTRGIRMLKDTGLLPYVSAELQAAVGMTQNKHHVHDVFDHTMEVLKNTKPELVNRLTALFHDIGKTVTRSESETGVHFYGHEMAGADIVDKVMHDLKYPTDLIDMVKAGVRNHMRLKHGGNDATKISDKTLRKFKIEVGDNLEHLLDVIHADNIAHADASAMPDQINKVRDRLNNLKMNVAPSGKAKLPITGDDLIAIGVPKGPLFGKIIKAVTDAWYENPNMSKEDAIEIAKKVV